MRTHSHRFIRASRHAALAGAGLLFFCTSPARALDPGDSAPRFSAPALDGRSTVDLSDLRGKVVLLDFWASWCPPCLTSLPKLEKLRTEISDGDFRVVAVNVDQEPGNALRFLANNPIGYPSATDPEGLIPERFGLDTMPTSYLIDREGVIRYVHKGFQRGDEKTLRDRIESLLRTHR